MLRKAPGRGNLKKPAQAAGFSTATWLAAAAGWGTTTPQVMIIFMASSTDMSSSTTWRRGTSTK